MQASKVKVNEIYAVKFSDKLVRFQVRAVVTRRINNYNNPHDYVNHVEGVIIENKDDKVVKVTADSLLGPYEEQVELVERDKRERAEVQRKKDEAERLRHKLRDLLYSKTGIQPPENEREYHQPFRAVSDEVEIRGIGIERLIDYLEQH